MITSFEPFWCFVLRCEDEQALRNQGNSKGWSLEAFGTYQAQFACLWSRLCWRCNLLQVATTQAYNTNDLGSTLMISHACCNGGDVTPEVTSDKGMPPMPSHNKTMTITLKATLLIKADEKRRVTKEREVKVLGNLLQFLATWKLLLKRRLW